MFHALGKTILASVGFGIIVVGLAHPWLQVREMQREFDHARLYVSAPVLDRPSLMQVLFPYVAAIPLGMILFQLARRMRGNTEVRRAPQIDVYIGCLQVLLIVLLAFSTVALPLLLQRWMEFKVHAVRDYDGYLLVVGVYGFICCIAWATCSESDKCSAD